MASQYTHKVTFQYEGGTTTLQIHRSDDYGAAMARWADVYNQSHTVTVQKYPLKYNPIKTVKGGE